MQPNIPLECSLTRMPIAKSRWPEADLQAPFDQIESGPIVRAATGDRV